MTNVKPEKTIAIELDAAPKAKLKALGGADRDTWNARLSNLVAAALPVNQDNIEASKEAATAALSGVVDINPADPVEGMLIAQLIVAHEAALSMYRRAWQQSPEYFEARTRYLALADKATRTVALLTERLDERRGRGQQQIVVKHVTVNADQAVVTDSVVSGKSSEGLSSAKLVATPTEGPMPIIDPHATESVPVAGGGTKAK